MDWREWNYIRFAFDGMDFSVPVKISLRHTANTTGETEDGHSPIRVKPKSRRR